MIVTHSVELDLMKNNVLEVIGALSEATSFAGKIPTNAEVFVSGYKLELSWTTDE